MEPGRKRHLLEELVKGLSAERGIAASTAANEDGLWDAFRALVNTRPAWAADARWIEMQDELLTGMIAEAGICGIDSTEAVSDDGRVRLWRGDITTLDVDAIVNAANSRMLGCWVPGHHCIDNAIHTFAGVQLRAECARIMEEQGCDEPTGAAKITAAYNLPSRHVIHTVGPIADGRPNDAHRMQLASCYRSCLDLAAKYGLRSLGFCCISTGIFGFPQKEAARIAVDAVRGWLESHGGMTVVFDVFSETDYAIYRRLLLGQQSVAR